MTQSADGRWQMADGRVINVMCRMCRMCRITEESRTDGQKIEDGRQKCSWRRSDADADAVAVADADAVCLSYAIAARHYMYIEVQVILEEDQVSIKYRSCSDQCSDHVVTMYCPRTLYLLLMYYSCTSTMSVTLPFCVCTRVS